MLNLTLVVCLLLSLIVVYFVLIKPLFRDKIQLYYQTKPATELFDESLSILETLTELETDYKMGKLTQEDYEVLALEYKKLYLEKKTSAS